MKKQKIKKLDIVEEFDKKYGEFLIRYVPIVQESILKGIKAVIETLDYGPDKKGFNLWPADKLISAKEKLARYSEPLGEAISHHEIRSDFSYIWRKGQYASDYSKTKADLTKELKDKATAVEVDSALTSRYIEEQYYSMFHRRRADDLIRMMEVIDRMIRTIDSRLRELDRQYRLPHDQEKRE